MVSTSTPQSQTHTVWEIDPAHTVVELTARHMMFAKVRGRFGTVRGTIVYDEEAQVPVSVEAEIDAASIDTREPQRDAHLRSADFLDVENHPHITFRSTRVERVGEGRFRIAGDLTIRGVTREVVLDATYNGRDRSPFGKVVAGVSATTTINRQDFGLTWNVALETGGVLVGDAVAITLEVEALLRE